MPQLEKLDRLWARVIGAHSPVPFELKRLLRDRWVRFHSLPESKRYAESPAEMQTILLRHNTVLDELVRPAESLFLITTAYSDRASGAERCEELLALDVDAHPWRVVTADDPDDDPADDADPPSYWHFSASEWSWRTGLFDELLQLVAEDVLANVSIVSCDSGCLYHPYDGGADVILPTTAQRDELSQSHRDWLSDHPLGW